MTGYAPIVVTAKNQSLGLSGDDVEAAKARFANPGIGVTSASRRRLLYRYIPAAGTANSPSVQLNQADRLGVYVGAKINGDFSPGFQL